MADLPSLSDSDEKKFLGFIYPEIKDLSKQFLALISAVLAFSVAFADKIIYLSHATPHQKLLITLPIILWVVAAIMTGISLMLNFVSAARILKFQLFSRSTSYRGLVKVTYLFLDVGGFLFVAGLALIAAAGISKL